MRGLYEDELKSAFRPNFRIGQDIYSRDAQKAVAAKNHLGLFASRPGGIVDDGASGVLENRVGSNCPENGLARAAMAPRTLHFSCASIRAETAGD
jgi:hypothetical protein